MHRTIDRFVWAGKRERSTRVRIFSCVWILVFSIVPAAHAQGSLSDLPVGERIRVHAPANGTRPVTGNLAARVSDSVSIVRGDASTLTLAIDDISTLDRSSGRSRGLGAVMGAVGGAISGVLLGVACSSICDTGSNSGANLAPIGGFVVGLPAGAIMGAIIGIERWHAVRVR